MKGTQDTCALTAPAWRELGHQGQWQWGSLCRAGLNLFQINSQVVGGDYAAPLLLGISKRSLLEGQASTPPYAAYTGWHADTMFSLVPSKTQVTSHTGRCAPCINRCSSQSGMPNTGLQQERSCIVPYTQGRGALRAGQCSLQWLVIAVKRN